ncbi:MAG: Kelch repeat type 1-containing protein [Sphingobacteriales bacterium]|nr:Kelch repeat type 1-containing protein [Sphingobacteriales bacterium]
MIPIDKRLLVFILVALLNYSFIATNHAIAQPKSGWNILEVKGVPTKREDCGFVEVDGLFYLIGGRGILAVDVFNPSKNVWLKKRSTPFEMHHFQAVAYKKEIYIVGGMTSKFPHETPLDHIYIYNPKTDIWRKGAEIPKNRRRGSGGTVVFKNKIFLVGGIQDGHFDGTVNWMDAFDPLTNTWETFKDAPHARDHFHATVINNKLYASGGRRTSFKTKQVVDLTIPEIDVYDFKSNQWQTLPETLNLPTQRAGCITIAYKDQLYIIGGESYAQEKSHMEVEAFNVNRNVWLSLPGLVIGRHDTQSLVYKNKLYIVAGSANRGGGPDQNTIEVLKLTDYLD